jgi:predicted glycosyltransferase
MRILLELGHPKHVHLFRPLLKRWKAQNDLFQIVTRDKDITHELLDHFGLPYVCLSRQRKGGAAVLELLVRWFKFALWIHRFRPDLVISVAGITTALPAKMLGVPNIALTDTETATLSNRIAFPFADCILTPEWFNVNFGPRHHTYRGVHEWAYLHPDEFQADAGIVREEGIDPTQAYAFVRLVKWAAVHDVGERGFSPDDTLELVKGLSNSMRVYVSSEAALPPDLEMFRARFNVHHIHHILAFATLVVGESPSMATEAALLGVPAILVSSWAGRCGNMQALEHQFGLMRVFTDSSAAVKNALQAAVHPPERAEILERRNRCIQQFDCVTDVVERYINMLVEKPEKKKSIR